MMLYKNMKTMGRTSDNDTNLFDIIAGSYKEIHQ